MTNDIRVAVRQVLFQNYMDNWPYSHGGTLFVVSFAGQCYGLTCWHVVKHRPIDDLLVMPTLNPAIGTSPVPVKTVGRINAPDSDLKDIAVIAFAPEVTMDVFGGTAYILDSQSIGTSETAHRLKVYGYLSEKSHIDFEAKSIIGGFCDLQFTEIGDTSSDPFLRKAVATYPNHDFSSFDGISGSPVFDETAGRLCGMVARGGLSDDGAATIMYLDISDIMKFVQAFHAGQATINYLKARHYQP